MLKKISFAIAILGIGFLLGMLVWPAEELGDISGTLANEKVFLEGEVDSERGYVEFRILKIKGIDVYCECDGNYLGKEVYVEGYVSEFDEKKRLNVLRIVEK